MHPRQNYELIGHEAAENAFVEAWTSGRTAHAWLITGPEGIGKATLAYRIARFVLAKDDPVNEGTSLFGDELPANKASLLVDRNLPVCQQIERGSNPDFRVLEPGMLNPSTGRTTQQIVVAQVRAALEVTTMTAAAGGWRVIIIDPADSLNVNAANAILKNLEEPPAQTLFLLVSHAPGRLLPTIRSRCRRLDLKPLPVNQVQELLGRVGGVTDERVCEIAELSRGSIGKAIELANGNGMALYEAIHRAASGLPSVDVTSLHALGDLVAKRKNSDTDIFPILATMMSDWLAALVLAGARGHTTPEVVPGEHALQDRLLRDGAPLDQWVEVWEKVTALLGQTDHINLDRKQVIIESFSLIGAAASSSAS